MKFLIIVGRLAFVLGALLITFSICANAQGGAAKPAAATDKIGGFIKKSGFKYTEFKKGVWTVDSEHGPILIGGGDDFVVIFMIVAKKDSFRVTEQSMVEMLKLSGDLDFLEMNLDEAGDLSVRAEAKVKLMDQKLFEEALQRVVSGYAEAAARLAPFVIK